jgi:ADP-ribosylglycohydrolase
MNTEYLNGILGFIVGDAMGVPYEFITRDIMEEIPATEMIGYGTHYQPKGTWSDDTSMTLATLDSLKNGYDATDIMNKYVAWYTNGKYTANGNLFDIGGTTERAIWNYMETKDISTCGCKTQFDNGNGSLMRMLPICLHCINQPITDETCMEIIHEVSSLTHGHMISKIACGIYYWIIHSIVNETPIQFGIDKAFQYYQNETEIICFERIKDIKTFGQLSATEIKSSGYVVSTLEASLWCYLTTENYKDCVLKAINLGGDTDTISAIAGSFAGLTYGYEDIPEDWLNSIKRLDYIKRLCK